MAYFLKIFDQPEALARAKYEVLLKTCFAYSKFFSLAYAFPWSPTGEKKDWNIEPLQPFLFDEYCTDDEEWYNNGRPAHIRTYHCDPKAIPILLDYAPIGAGLSEQGYPEDLTFFCGDGSVFFDSVSHEGDCGTSERDGEDIQALLAAIEHQLSVYKDTSGWIQSIWTAKRITPLRIPPAQQAYLKEVVEMNRKHKQELENYYQAALRNWQTSDNK